MAGESQASASPLLSFSFTLQLEDGTTASFAEVTGLDTETKDILYRGGDHNSFLHNKLPGLEKVGKVTLRKGILAQDSKIFDWNHQTLSNPAQPRTVIISLLDQSGSPRTVWTLHQSVPVKLSLTDFKAEGSEIVVDSLELMYETLTVSMPD